MGEQVAPRTLLVTGGAGFIGTNFVRYLLQQTDVRVIVLDAFTYAGQRRNLAQLEGNPRCQIVHGRVEDAELVQELCQRARVDTIVNLAAHTHVDRSILDAHPFVDTNVRGTVTLLEVARRLGIRRFVQMSTDEVYGECLTGAWAEDAPLMPSSPYAASKAAADCFVQAYVRTYGVPAFLVRSCNVYGPYQFPEKLIPMSILCALQGEPIPLYGDGSQRRQWLAVEDLCRALWLLCCVGQPGNVYHVSSGVEWENRHVVTRILELVGASVSLLRSVPDRPGHDRRYALQWDRLRSLGWEPRVSFDEGLEQTVQWYRQNRAWWEPLWNGEYARYRRLWYEQMLRSGESMP
ncbi:dTDP-glucose 4,6-dehydratase [bacterium HR21]|nr:dTDP-glucose 4,6-dehydratase [bacterium HR21]